LGSTRADLPPLVLIHGAQQEGFCWASLARRLDHLRVLTPDLPGHGGNAAPAPTRVEDFADWLLAWLDAQGIAETVLGGHSLGSLVALEAAARQPPRIAKLILIGTAAPMRVATRLLETAATNPAKAMAIVNRGSHSVRGWLAAPSPTGLWSPGMNLRLMERQPPATLAAGLGACNAYAGALDAAARVRCPTLVVTGSEDRMTPPAAAQPLIERLADVRVAPPGLRPRLCERSAGGAGGSDRALPRLTRGHPRGLSQPLALRGQGRERRQPTTPPKS
jgi:pimeloyl-ACP methyl ester carboxylesterase